MLVYQRVLPCGPMVFGAFSKGCCGLETLGFSNILTAPGWRRVFRVAASQHCCQPPRCFSAGNVVKIGWSWEWQRNNTTKFNKMCCFNMFQIIYFSEHDDNIRYDNSMISNFEVGCHFETPAISAPAQLPIPGPELFVYQQLFGLPGWRVRIREAGA